MTDENRYVPTAEEIKYWLNRLRIYVPDAEVTAEDIRRLLEEYDAGREWRERHRAVTPSGDWSFEAFAVDSIPTEEDRAIQEVDEWAKPAPPGQGPASIDPDPEEWTEGDDVCWKELHHWKRRDPWTPEERQLAERLEAKLGRLKARGAYPFGPCTD
jgi:hypothetical protein